ncbi:MAG: hypothetical protein PHI73_02505 [Patescibacteria group bacterium]|nr:hypothetical protein [Patescibacteria group bacterium]
MKKRIAIFSVLGAAVVFIVGCQIPFTQTVFTLPLLEKSPDKVLQLSQDKMTAVKSAHSDLEFAFTLTQANNSSNGKLKLLMDSDQSNLQGQLQGTFASTGSELKFDIDIKSANDIFYFRIPKIPQIPGLDVASLSEIEGKWFRLDPVEMQKAAEDALKNSGLTNQNTNTQLPNQEQQKKLLDQAKELVNKYNLYSVDKRLPDQKLDGVNCYRYSLAINIDEIKKFTQELLNSSLQTLSSNSGITSETIQSAVDAIYKNVKALSGEMAIGKKDYFVRQLVVKASMDVETDTKADFTITLNQSKINQPVTVEAPTESENFMSLFQDFLTGFMGGFTGGTSEDVSIGNLLNVQSQATQIDNLQQALAIIYENSGDYPVSLETLVSALGDACDNTGLPTQTLACSLKDEVETTDVFTNQPYAYEKEDGAYALLYQMDFSDEEAASIRGTYVKGQNTLTPDSISLEAEAQADTANGDGNSSTDTDGDGLSDTEEAEWGTEPSKADSDGDGFLDGEEVESGYNPLGDGKIEATE